MPTLGLIHRGQTFFRIMNIYFNINIIKLVSPNKCTAFKRREKNVTEEADREGGGNEFLSPCNSTTLLLEKYTSDFEP